MKQPYNPNNLKQIYRPSPNAHKGDGGRVLIIGGSVLFHASIFWSADVASRLVDLVHFSSPANENNQLVRYQLKQGFWNGIVVDFSDIDSYIDEDESILIGPGMPRVEGLAPSEQPTAIIINQLLIKHPSKKWVIDGGALQEVDPTLFKQEHIITPHQGEWTRMIAKTSHPPKYAINNWDDLEERLNQVSLFSIDHNQVTVLAKGMVDIACQGDDAITISGGNPGLSKGGTGDVLAGLVVSLYAKNPSLLAASTASFLLKTAADQLQEKVGTMYNTSDLVLEISKVWKTIS